MKLFLSWSGEVSHEVAHLFREWLPSVLQFVDPYLSSEDIDKGARWLNDILGELEASHYGILFVTRDNHCAPWLNFEAGALAKAVQKSRVMPLLFDILPTDFSGPLTQFQMATTENLDLFKVVTSINAVAPDAARLRDDVVRRSFEKWWPDMAERLDQLKSRVGKRPATRQPTEEQRLLRELVELTRTHHTLLRSPELLLPQEYLQEVVKAAQFDFGHDGGSLPKALRQIERTLFRLHEEFTSIRPRIKGVPKNQVDHIESLIQSCREPLDHLVEHLKA